jgi:hypothetical protein
MNQGSTFFVRVLLWGLLFLVAISAGLLYLASEEMARIYHEVAHLQMPIYIACLVGFIPVTMGILLVFQFLRLVDLGEAFSQETVQLLRRERFLLIVTGVYMLVGFIGVTAAVGDMTPGVPILLFAAEVVVLFLIALASLLEGLFSKAYEFRQETELTV